MEDTQEQHKKQYDWLKQYQFQKGQSGNPGGARKGKKMKTMAAELLENMDDEEKAEWLKTQTPEFVWRMAEGNPKQDTDITTGGNPFPIYGGQSIQDTGHNSDKENL